MTPTEQANKLVKTMYPNTLGFYQQTYTQAIKCALVAVELLIDCTHSEDITRHEIGADGYDKYKKYTFEYWQDVKAELKQKLFQ